MGLFIITLQETWFVYDSMKNSLLLFTFYIISQISIFNLVHVQCHINVSKQTTLLDGVDGALRKWCVCGPGLNPSVREGMEEISNVKVYSRLAVEM